MDETVADAGGGWDGRERRGGGADSPPYRRVERRWQDVAIFAAAAFSAFVAIVAGFFLVLTFRTAGEYQAKRDADRVAILRETDAHRCRTEQLMQALFEAQHLPVPAYPDGIEPPANCAVIGNRTQEVTP